MKTRPVPPGFHSLTPHLELRGAARAIEFYKTAFGAREIFPTSVPTAG
jgi:PhnB protein